MSCSVSDSFVGVNSKLGVAASNPGSPPASPTKMLEFDSCSVALHRTRADSNGIIGTVGSISNRVVDVQRMVQGTVSARPVPLDIEWWLPYITGGTLGGSAGSLRAITLAESTSCLDLWELIGGTAYVYRENRVTGARFRGSEGGLVSMDVDLVGRDRDDPPTDSFVWPAISIADGSPFQFAKATLQVPSGGTAYRLFDFQLDIRNGYQPRFGNSLTITDMIRGKREITLGVNFAYGSAYPLLSTFTSGASSFLLDVQYTVASTLYQLQFECPAAVAMDLNDPGIPGQGEIRWDLALSCKFINGSSASTQLTTRIKSS